MLLKKVEELTLYLLEKDEQLKSQDKKIDDITSIAREQQSQLKLLASTVAELKKQSIRKTSKR